MALNGTLNSGNYQGRYVQFSWTATQNIAKNQSTISWTLKGAGDAESSWYNSAPFYVSIGGEVVYEGGSRIKLYKGTQVASGTKVINHGNDGKGNFTVSIKAAIYSYSYNCSGSKTFTLDTIPRAATITSAPNFNDEENPVIKYSNAAGNSVTSLKICIAKTDGSTILVPYRDISKTGTSYTFSLTDAERKALRVACNTANSMTVRFYIMTTIGGTNYYNYVAKTLSIVNAKPTLSPIVEDVRAEALTLTGNKNTLIKYFSDVSFNFGASAKKEANIVSRKLENGTKSSVNNSGTLYSVDSGTFKFTVTDSRGNTASTTVTKTMINYVALNCVLEVKPELVSNNTTTLSISTSGNYFNGSFGARANALTVRWRYKTIDGAYSSWFDFPDVEISGNKFNTYLDLTGLDYTKSYMVQAVAFDLIRQDGFITKEITVKTQPVFDWSENDFNFNVPVYYEGLCLSGAAKALTNSYALTTTASGGTNWTNNGFTATLLGNNLRCTFDATRSTATGTGNIGNETILSVSINHGGKIKAAYSTGFSSGGTGGVATFTIADAANSGGYLSFNINIAAVGSAITQTSGAFIIPVVLNLDKY